MATTAELVNYLEIQAPGWNRLGSRGLLEILDQAQGILYRQGSHQSMILDANGRLPVIATTNEVYEYDIPGVWRIDQVLVKPPYSSAFENALVDEYGIASYNKQPVKPYVYAGIEYFKFQQVRSVDAKNGVSVKLRFEISPGDTTDDYHYIGYANPVQLTSESIRLSLPIQLHYTHLLPAAMKLVDGYQNGTIIESIAYITQVIMPQVQDALNKGEQGEDHSVTRFEE